jgi:hypothetical protein
MLSVDLAAEEGWPLVLVTCGRLGSINHALLSLEAAKARGMKVAGVVHDWCEGADPLIDRDAAETVRRHLAKWGFPEVVVEVPRFRRGGPYPDVDFSALFASPGRPGCCAAAARFGIIGGFKNEGQERLVVT